MRCSQLETRLNDLLDRREDPSTDAEIVAHTVACRRCRRVTAAYAAVAEGATALADDSHFLDESHEAIAPSSQRFGVVRGTVASVWAVAAALLLYFTAAPTPSPMQVAATPSVTNITTPTVVPDSMATGSMATGRPEPMMVVEFARNTGLAYVGLLHGTARGVDGAFSLAASVPPANELLEPVLFADDGLFRQFNDEWLPAAGATLDVIEQAFAEEAPVRS